MEYKEKVKHLDFVIKNIENAEMFDINNILYKNPDLSETYESVGNNVKSFGIKQGLFSVIVASKGSSWHKLTPKGEKLKSFNKGFEKFEKMSEKKPLTKFEKLSIIGFIITFSYGFYQNNLSNSIENQQAEFQNEIDSLKNEIRNLNSHIDSLNFNFSKYYKTELLNKEIK